MAVVTVSTELGSGGTEIAAALARRLGYRLADRELIGEAARRSGLTEDKLDHLGDNPPSLFERFGVETRRYIVVTQSVLYDFAAGDDVVVVARGGQWLLRGIPHVLRVRVTAPFDVRVRRLGERLAARMEQTPPPRALAEMIRRDDAGKAGRMRYLYDVDIRDPALYDVVINTAHLGEEAAVELLVGLARTPALATTPQGARLMADRALAAQVEVALALHPETGGLRGLTVTASDGVVTLEGATLEAAAEVARSVPGVREVRERAAEIPPLPPFVA